MLTLESTSEGSVASFHRIYNNGQLIAEFRKYEDAQLVFKVLQGKYNKHWELDINSSNWSSYRIIQESSIGRSIIYLHKECYTAADVARLIRFMNEEFQ